MSELLTTPLLMALVAVILVALAAYRWRSKPETMDASQRARLDRLDTVADWPPEGTRLLNNASRKAHASLVEALPECTVFAQVPVARFVRVPRRQSYSEWITRVGHMAVDFLICDKSTMALGVVILQNAEESPRAVKRRERIQRVLKHAGIKLFVWRDDAVPSVSAARAMIMQTGSNSSAFETLAAHADKPLPVPEVAPALEPALDETDPWGSLDRPRDPPPSTWFDDLDSGPGALTPTPAPQKANA
jgi:hypothetical protein